MFLVECLQLSLVRKAMSTDSTRFYTVTQRTPNSTCGLPCQSGQYSKQKWTSKLTGTNSIRSKNKFVVLKRVPEKVAGLAQRLKTDFAQSNLRHHIDVVEKEKILVYEYFNTDLLQFVKNHPALPIATRKSILKEVGFALREMHSEDWIHLGGNSPINPVSSF